MKLILRTPDVDCLPSYQAALERGWSPDNVRPEAAQDHLRDIKKDAASFLAGHDDPEAKGPAVQLPDGSLVQRLPGIVRWLWDDEFCGVIGFRWQAETSVLPRYVLGHVGYAVVPWKRGRGYATEALKALLPEAKRRGLTYIELTTDPDNIPSQRVITKNNGVLVERFIKDEAYGGKPALRWQIMLQDVEV